MNTFDLELISRILPNPTYDKQKFAAITIRIHSPMCTVLLFTSGKMVLTGCKNFAECCQASLEIVSIMRSGLPGVVMNLTEVRIQNIVGNVDLNLGERTLDLDRFYYDQSVYSTFQKNMFPGLIYRPNNSPVVLLLFSSGKVVITGGKASRDIYDGWNALWPLVSNYIKDS
jgi:transcription initiation factor TFIID TATA-box-binding protein